LILDHDRADPHPLIGLDGVHDVLDVTVTVVGVDQDRQVDDLENVANRTGNVPKRPQPDVWNPEPRSHYGKSPNEARRTSGPRDQPSAQRVIGAEQDQRLLGGKRLSKIRSHH
jgi:hypothetical protein